MSRQQDTEKVDIVDERNIVLYQATKTDAHEKGLLHRTVIVEVKDLQRRWLFVKQASDRQDAGQYVLPVGGHVMAGETEEEALKREAFEELGLKDFEYKLIGKAIFNRRVLNRQENHYFILYEIYSEQQPVINYESDSYKYFTEEELKKALRENPQKFGNAFHFVVKTFFQIYCNQR